jgi:lipopolysaccharide/colanic/teichoic acid biosynthesis glycosyltransferase/glycosyltransferase involved in cell wall biosynthesis
LLQQTRPHVIHAFDTKPGVYGCLAAWSTGVPVVVGTVTGLGSLYTPGSTAPAAVRRVYEALQWLAARTADVTIFQNRDDRAEFVARRIVPAHRAALVRGSGVPTALFDPERFTPAQRRDTRAALGIPADALLVTLVSRAIRSKGVGEFVAAAGAIRQRRPDVHFLLVGHADHDSVDGFSATELQSLQPALHWPGPRRDVAAILAASDLFVLPSYLREGIPRALLEAAAMGLPIVTTDSPGCNDVVQPGVSGLLVPPRDVPALITAIEHLLDHPEQRRAFGQAARARAVAEFDLDVVARATESLYRELLERKRVRPGRERPCPVPKSKRLLDVLVASCALALTAPLILLGAAAIKLTSPGPAFYRARRAGLGGRLFCMLKLRTMRPGSDTPQRKITDADDDRVTTVGRWLRRLKIDELPQLWNVLKGDMSIVGPRPEDWDLVERHYTAEARRTLDVLPGIASPVDVAWYPDLTHHDPAAPGVPTQDHYLRRHLPLQVHEALRYVERRSLLGDLGVMLKLVTCVVAGACRAPGVKPLPPDIEIERQCRLLVQNGPGEN